MQDIFTGDYSIRIEKIEMNELISVIVPVYNVEKYLRKCVESILTQTYENIEVILVDDGSEDSSGMICDEYAAKDSRVIVVHKTNAGLSAARNTGIEKAQGTFFGFVDSDDWIEPTMYEKLYDYMLINNCDSVECAVNIIYDDHSELYDKGDNYTLTGNEALRIQLKTEDRDNIPRIAVWSRLHKASFWKTNRFPEGKVHEDFMLTCKELYQSKRFGVVNEGLYNHFSSNLESITHAKFSKRDLFLEEQYHNRILFLEENNEDELKKLAEIKYYRLLFSLYGRCRINRMAEEEQYYNLIKKNKYNILKSEVHKREKIKTCLLLMSPSSYWFYMNHLRQKR